MSSSDEESWSESDNRLLDLLLRADDNQKGRLHEVERLILADLLDDNRRLRCFRCKIWLQRLATKMGIVR